MRDDEYLPSSLAEVLAIDSGNETDEREDYDDIDSTYDFRGGWSKKGRRNGGRRCWITSRALKVPENVLTWYENFDQFTGVEFYQEQSGPTIQETSPIKIFKVIWDRQIMETIVEQTNMFA